MQFGIWVPLPHTIRPEPRMIAAEQDLRTQGQGQSDDRSFAFARDVVVRAEELGFSTCLVAERWLGPDLSAWMLGSALAISTRSIEIMVAVHPGIVQPQQVAKFAASLDRLSGGRAAVNIVNGWWEEEFELFSNGASQSDGDVRYRRMDEYLKVMRGLWSARPFAFDGAFYKVRETALPLTCVQRGGPRIYAGTRHDPGKQVVAGQGDCWFVNYEPDFRLFDVNVEQIQKDISDMRARVMDHGRQLSFGMSCHVIAADDDRVAEDEALALEEHGKKDRISFISSKALGPGLVGTPQRIAARLRAYEKAGLDLVLLHFHPMIEGLEYFASEVMPLVQKENA